MQEHTFCKGQDVHWIERNLCWRGKKTQTQVLTGQSIERLSNLVQVLTMLINGVKGSVS